jgi:hypothetical protein
VELADTVYRHQITGQRIILDKCCKSCVHFSDKKRTTRGVEIRIIKCTLNPRGDVNLNDGRTSWHALNACERWSDG